MAITSDDTPHAAERSRTVLGLGLIVAALAAILWPLFVIGRLGFLCSPSPNTREDPVCADGISYLFSFVHIAVGSAVALVVIIVMFRRLISRPTDTRRKIFAATSLSSPALIAFVVLDSPPVDVTPAIPALAFASASAALCIASALATVAPVSYMLAASSTVVGLIGAIIEPGVASPLLATASIAVASAVFGWWHRGISSASS